jgi:hypothetical protein
MNCVVWTGHPAGDSETRSSLVRFLNRFSGL